MNIHEHQGKDLLRRYGVAVLDGGVAFTPEEKAAFDKSCDAVKKLIEDFRKLGV